MATKKKTEETAVATKEETALTVSTGLDFETQAGSGFEEADSDSFAIPFLVLLQKGSPQVDEDSSTRVDGAKSGQFYNTVTSELFDDIDFVPVHYSRAFTNWRSREEGGGYLGQFLPDDPIVEPGERGQSGRLILPDGTYLADTRYHFGLVVTPTGVASPVLIGMSSTQIKKSRNFMSVMKGLKMERADGSKYTPPMFSHMYRISSVSEAKDQYTWKGLKIEMLRPLDGNDLDLYLDAKEFKAQITDGAAKIGNPPDADGAATTDDSNAEF